MRWLAIALLLGAASLGSIAMTSGSDASARRVYAGGGVSLGVPRGWRLLRSAVALGPDQVGVVASFPARFARRPCPCARPNYPNCGVWCEEPNITNFPRAGAILFVWKFPIPDNPADQGRGYLRHRPARFAVTQADAHFATTLARKLRHLHRTVGHACVEGPGSHPSWWSDFDDGGYAFQLEVYLGPAAGHSVRTRLDGLLDSFEVARPTETGKAPS